ncbi:ABC transporter permease [Pikeienuella piscinae]|uniref:ABC transporter permease n=1 Tax=Pikeienuella piscinae TaxID=2748098 RepID=A0A7L5BTS1_9RHOB|nr:ABC transporter permease [Pikeienuella piscinae]QIE55530.1 ABC transporter permease [Pikeienuella piscinae]
MTDANAEPVSGRPTAPWRKTLRRLFGHRGFVIGAVILVIMLVIAVAGVLGVTGDPLAISYKSRLVPPSQEFLFGTDHYGRSIFTRVMAGAHLSLVIGASVVAITAVLGTLIGAAAGYFQRLDGIIMRSMDALMAFPPLMLAIAIAAALGMGLVNLVVALGVTYTPRTARIARAAVLGVRRAEYVESARLSGASDSRIILRHILPNSMAPLVVDLTFVFAYAILAEAALSFLGVGPPPPTPTWGNIIAEGRDYMVEAPWISIFPGLIIAFTVLGLNMLGDGLRDVLDPRLNAS